MINLKVVVFLLYCLYYVKAQQLQPILLVHGGAGDVSDESIPLKKYGVKLAARLGYEILKDNGSSLDAVEKAVRFMEEYSQFNAGLGSVLTWDGTVEMDAAIMDGASLDAGCVSVVQDIMNPITLARRVMEKTRHRYLAAEGVMKFAESEGFEILPKGSLVTSAALKALENYKNSLNATQALTKLNDIDTTLFGSPGTVGAVAIDVNGNVAAATSTGGITGKLSGRIGDSPILGGGTYADNESGAVSATGPGEFIMRYNVASRILALVQHRGLNAHQATKEVLENMKERFNQTAGVISIDANGTLGIVFTSKRMSWAYQSGNELHFGVDEGEDQVEIVTYKSFSFL
ncbi:probable isoaspartyl peptidase/L-asparaginase GA20639 [Teleopsis dalmanni]|uniref:probable isoaspartyl peptidase/L-asparaginase GA20639 n=1 Tax=Teleopsis dalmanni TaxID=139649 RepID=UPI0018CDE809|nr:probable isoaspartyl peptidase/L-asparaginase GA20639 [Teleopsis dalmanni]